MTSPPDYDVIIIGGGMTGASLAIALSQEKKARVAIVEAVSPYTEDQPSYDDRGLALSISSQRILQAFGLWEAVATTATPIQRVHVSDQHHFGFVRLHADSLRMPALGYVVIARELGHVLLEKIYATENIDLICPAEVEDIVVQPERVVVSLLGKQKKSISGRLLVAADGTHSKTVKLLGIKTDVKDYGQTAIVTNITPGRQHNNTAYERFTTHGPLALLPLNENRCVLVFTVNRDQEKFYMNLGNRKFLDNLQSQFGRRLGVFQQMGNRKSYPMQLVLAREQVRERVVVLGNSAHTIHPNGAQGFNLCLRDVAGLAEILMPVFHTGADPGQRRVLNQYLDLREHDQKAVVRFTDGMAGLFYNDLLHKIFFRNSAMLIMDTIPSLKNSFMQRAMGVYGHQPSPVRGIPLCQ